MLFIYIIYKTRVKDKKYVVHLKIFTPSIVSRLNSALNVNLNGNDIPNLISLCSFDSLKGQNWIQSPWCDVFSKEEYKQNEYYYDLSKF